MDESGSAGFWVAADLVDPSADGRSPRHARKDAPRYAASIGRVGALAVALGVGLAVAHSPAVAYASPDSDSDTDSSSAASSAAESSSAPAKKPRTGLHSAGSTGSGSAGGQDGSDSGDAGTGSRPAKTKVSSSGGATTSSPRGIKKPKADASAETPQDSDTTDPSDSSNSNGPDVAAPVTDTGSDNSAAPPPAAGGNNNSSPNSAEPAAASTVSHNVDNPVAAPADPIAENNPAVDNAPTVTPVGQQTPAAAAATTENTTIAPESATAPAPEASTDTNVVSAFVATLLTPFVNPVAPAAPAQNPLLTALLAWVRREIIHTFFNKTPVVGQITTSQPLAGMVRVNLHESDPNGDPLSYTITQPENGFVYRDLITGEFVYQALQIAPKGGYEDSFTVTISDSAQTHLPGTLGKIQSMLEGISRLFGLAQKDDLTITVPVTVMPLEMAPGIATWGTSAYVIGHAPVHIIQSVTITDNDSINMKSATIKLTTLSQDGDELQYVAPQDNPIVGSWDAESKTMTLTGTATIAQYEEAIKAVTFTATQGAILVRGVAIAVTDDTDRTSLASAATINVFDPTRPAIGTVGSPTYIIGKNPVHVIASVTITDADSSMLKGATVKLTTLSQDGDELKYVGPEDGPISGSWDAASKTLTLTGLASIDDYEDAIKAVTFTATQGDFLVRGVEVAVIDDDGLTSIAPGVATINVFYPPAPVIATGGAPSYVIGKNPVHVIDSVTITDADSSMLKSATIKLTTLSQDGDELKYVGPEDGPITGSWDAASKTLTLTGLASIADYKDAIKAVTFTATQGALAVRGVEVSVTDEDGMESPAPGIALINVFDPIGPGIATVGAPSYTIGKTPVHVFSSVTITDADSSVMTGATVKLVTFAQTGDKLSYVTPEGGTIQGSYDEASKTLTLTGIATKAQYEEALKAVTFTGTQGAGAVRGVEVSITDDDGITSTLPLGATINVFNPPAPVITTVGSPIYLIGKTPAHVIASVLITDADSTMLKGATVKLTTLSQTGDKLSYVTPEGGTIQGSYDEASKTLTLTGTATIADYQNAIKAVTFTATQGALLVRGVEVSVTDIDGVEALLPGIATINVFDSSSAPVITTIGTPLFKLGKAPVHVVSSVLITDIDSTRLSGATVTIATSYSPGDALDYTAPQSNPITGSWDEATRTLTLTGVGTKAQYEEALKAVTFTAATIGITRGISITVTDEDGIDSLIPGAALISVLNPIGPGIATAGAPSYTIGKSPVHVFASVTITDADSSVMTGATVKLVTLAQAGDKLSYVTPEGGTIQGSYDEASKTLTLTGIATKAQYEEALKAVTFTGTQGAGAVRGVEVSISDDDGFTSTLPLGATVNVFNPLPPGIAVAGIDTYVLGKAGVRPIKSITITDGDSAYLKSATIRISAFYQNGDALSYSTPTGGNISGNWDAGSQTLTLTGLATKAEYEAAIEAVTFTATGGVGWVRSLSVYVTDDTDVDSATLSAVTVHVANPVRPGIATVGAPTFHLWSPSPVHPVSSVTITDGDSSMMTGARLKITAFYTGGDALSYTTPQGGTITGIWDNNSRTLTLSGTASISDYEAAIRAVGFTATGGWGLARTIEVYVTDDSHLESAGAGLVQVWVYN